VRRFGTAIVAAAFLMAGTAAEAADRHKLNLPGGRLGDALVALGRQAGISIGVSDPSLANRRVGPVRGTFTVEEALRRLLRGTGAGHRVIDSATVLVLKQPQSAVRNVPARPREARRERRPPPRSPLPAPRPMQTTEPPGETEILVTGSRIARPDLNSPSPVATVDGAQFQLTATQSIEALINDLPQAVPATSRTSNNAGAYLFPTIDLRGLGAHRTLILVDNERLPASSVMGVVDISQIPIPLIERIDVMTGGATVAYGSDAVAGVVNFVLKQDFQGFELGGQAGVAGNGAGFNLGAQALYGANLPDGRGNITLFGSWFHREGVRQDRFDWSRVSQAIFRDPATETLYPVRALDQILPGSVSFYPGGSDFSPWGTVSSMPGNPFNQATIQGALPQQFQAPAGCTATPGRFSFNEAAQLTPLFSGGSCALPLRELGSSRYNFAPENFLTIPFARLNAGALGRYEFSNGVRARFFAAYTGTRSRVRLAPTPAGGGRGFIVDPTTAQFIPDDLRLALRTRPNPDAPFLFERRFEEAGPRLGRYANGAINLRGFLEKELGDGWRVFGGLGWGRNDLTHRQAGNINRRAVEQGVSGCGGGDPMPGCVPVDLFGRGSLTAEMLRFISVDTVDRSRYEQIRADVNLAGSFGELPGGPIGVAAGAEWRKDSAHQNPDPEKVNGDIIGFDARQPLRGGVDVREFYAEARLPLLRGSNFPELLAVEGGARYSHYSETGGLLNWKAAAEFAPLHWLRFRAAHNRASRAPAIFELFQAGDQALIGYLDPCNFNRPDRPTEFCASRAAAAGAPGFIQSDSQVQAVAFGEPNLREERASTSTAGIVVTPPSTSIGRVAMTADYYEIHLRRRIQSLGAQYYINQCYLGQAAAACARVDRNPGSGQIERVDTGQENSAVPVEVRGIDAGISWLVPLVDLFDGRLGRGRIRIESSFNYTISHRAGEKELVGLAGIIGAAGHLPRWSNIATLGYEHDGSVLQLRHVYKSGAAQTEFFGNGFTLGRVPDLHVVDASLRVKARRGVELTAVIHNLLGATPRPTVSGTFEQANVNASFFTPVVLGREFSIGARLTF
jgi:outer membrane receptor protein involved in Fe transport